MEFVVFEAEKRKSFEAVWGGSWYWMFMTVWLVLCSRFVKTANCWLTKKIQFLVQLPDFINLFIGTAQWTVFCRKKLKTWSKHCKGQFCLCYEKVESWSLKPNCSWCCSFSKLIKNLWKYPQGHNGHDYLHTFQCSFINKFSIKTLKNFRMSFSFRTFPSEWKIIRVRPGFNQFGTQ